MLQEEFGDELDIDKVGENSIKFFDDPEIFDYFMDSDQVKFWETRGHPFVKLTPEECQHHIPILGKMFHMLTSGVKHEYHFAISYFNV